MQDLQEVTGGIDLGQLIGVWAPCHGTGRTTIALAVAYKMTQLTKGKKILVCCANGSNSTLIKTMGISSDEIGIEDLVSFKLAGFKAGEYEKLLERKGGIFFAGSSKMTPAFSERFITEFVSIFYGFKEKFDISIVDLPSGKDNMLCNAVLSSCDKVITVLDSDADCSHCLSMEDMLLKKNILVINRYDKDTPHTLDIRNICSSEREVYEVPYCNVLSEMNNKGKLFQYLFLKTDFCSEIENIISSILGLNDKSLVTKMEATNMRLLRRLKISFVGGQQ